MDYRLVVYHYFNWLDKTPPWFLSKILLWIPSFLSLKLTRESLWCSGKWSTPSGQSKSNGSMVRFQFLAHFQVDNLTQPVIIIILYYFESFVFLWSLNINKSPIVSRTLLSILADLNDGVVWMVSCSAFIFKFLVPYTSTVNSLVILLYHTPTRVNWKVHRLTKILSWNVIK